MGKFGKLTVAALLIAGTSVMAQQASAKTAAKAPARASTSGPATIGGHPNINGVWQAMSGADFGLEPHSAQTSPGPQSERELGAIAAIPASLGVVEGGVIPYLPEAKKQRDANMAAGPMKDPEANCYLPGIPRATYVTNMPFQIIQGGGDILMAYEYDSANRVIAMGPVGIPPIDTWMGTSYGHWEGNTLVVTTLAQNGETWLDRTGNYLTNAATVTERFTLKDHDHMNYQVEIQDPSVFSKPWKISMPLYRRVEPNAQILEFKCVPFAEMHLYGDLYDTMDAAAKARLGLDKK
jgi:hypothetical protein